MKNIGELKKIIIKYINGEITPEELQALRLWLDHPKNRGKFREYVRIQHFLNEMHVPVNSEEAHAKVSNRLNEEQSGKKRIHFYSGWMKYAAVLIIGLGIGAYFLYNNTSEVTFPENQITLEMEDGTIRSFEELNQKIIRNESGVQIEQNEDKLVYKADAVKTTGEIKFNTLNVPYGRQFTLALADGTEVILDAGTKLKYPVSFAAGENRVVYLEGQAFFKVAEDSVRPFLVNTKKMEIRVLGTHFNVSAYPDDAKTSAVLVSGSIAATFDQENNLNSRSVVLKPGERARVENDKIEVDFVNVEKYVAWTNRELVFFNEVFVDIIKKLERRYNVKIKNEYSILNNIRITGNFRTETIEEVLETFQRHTAFEYQIEDNTITLKTPKK